MEDSFADKVVLVTGATSGIGRAVALKFAAASARVVALGRDQAALREIESAIKDVGGDPLALTVDVTNTDQSQRAINETIDKFGGLHVLVNAAGHISTGSIESTSLAAWDAMMNVNLRSVFQLMQFAAQHLIKTRGNIVNLSSVTGLRSFPGVLAYCVSKAGLDQLTRCAALELAAQGIPERSAETILYRMMNRTFLAQTGRLDLHQFSTDRPEANLQMLNFQYTSFKSLRSDPELETAASDSIEALKKIVQFTKDTSASGHIELRKICQART